MTRGAPRLPWISADDPPAAFPPAAQAFDEPNGLLAAGGDLSSERLLFAYRNGIFPWFDDGQPILWWSPQPRCVLWPDKLHIGRRTLRALKQSGFTITFNRNFDAVMRACSDPRPGQHGTWITRDMMTAYSRLHAEGWAHSVEVWQEDQLAGGIYGLAIDSAFFGESMFTRISNASKAAMLALCNELIAKDFRVLDCQVESPHLMTIGAEVMPRDEFLSLLDSACVAEKQRQIGYTMARPITYFMPFL